MLWAPNASELVLKVVEPALRVPVPSVAAPSLKVTVPPAADGLTVAVNVTDWPNTDGDTGEALSVVVEVAAVTVRVPVAELPW